LYENENEDENENVLDRRLHFFYFAVQQLFCIFATSILCDTMFDVAFIILKNKDKNIL